MTPIKNEVVNLESCNDIALFCFNYSYPFKYSYFQIHQITNE